MLIGLLPRNLISRLVGWLFDLQLPYPLQLWLNRLFVNVTGIDLCEANASPADFPSVGKLFIRSLPPGARPVKGEFVSPADGCVVEVSDYRQGEVMTVKGARYKVNDLVGDKAPVSGWQATVYLAPHNYHRVHAPVAGTLRRIIYLPGELWSVQPKLLARLPDLYVRNERLVFEIRCEPFGTIWLVMVGALNVGKMSTPFVAGFQTNQGEVRSRSVDINQELSIGEELGIFHLGSTVVLLGESDSHPNFHEGMEGQTIRVGESMQKT